MTHAQVAEKLGVTRMTLWNWLQNPDKIPYAKHKILEAMGILEGKPLITVCNKCNGSGIVRLEES